MEGLNLRKILRSKATLVGLIVLLGFMSFSLTNLLLRHWRLSSEIQALEAKAESMQQTSFKTKELIEYLNSQSFNEKEARLKLNLLSPNEKVAVIVGEPSQGKNDNDKVEKKSNLRKWLEYFFGSKN